MHDKLLQFQRNDVWTLVPRPEGEHIINTKWIFRNKIDEEGNVIRNKAHLVAQGYSQMEGVDYDETFAPVARMKSIKILLALAFHLKFKFYQMVVKTAFLNGSLKKMSMWLNQKDSLIHTFRIMCCTSRRHFMV